MRALTDSQSKAIRTGSYPYVVKQDKFYCLFNMSQQLIHIEQIIA